MVHKLVSEYAKIRGFTGKKKYNSVFCVAIINKFKNIPGEVMCNI
jgi:hypothetical protein